MTEERNTANTSDSVYLLNVADEIIKSLDGLTVYQANRALDLAKSHVRTMSIVDGNRSVR